MEAQSVEKPVVLVTGSSGLIGTRVMATLSSDCRVVGLDVKRPQQPTAGVDWIECDMTKDASVTQALARVREKYGNHVASVIHLTAYYDFSGEPSPLYQTLTVEGTRRLLKGLQKFQVQQLIFSSSLLVMKPAEEDEAITEASLTEAAWDYPRSKLAAEQVIRRERGGIPAVILRIAGVYDEDCHSIPIAQHVSRIYEKKLESYFFPGDSTRGQAFVHLDDLITCIRKAVELRRMLGPQEVFLIAEPDVMSYAEMQDRLGELIHGQEWPTIRIPKAVAKVGAWAQEQLAGEEDETFIKPWMVDLADAHYPVAIERAREGLGW
ncbi:MAG: NAD-dependent epimerase/dehydratase family protein, partial [Candidatus Binatia bacterium]